MAHSRSRRPPCSVKKSCAEFYCLQCWVCPWADACLITMEETVTTGQRSIPRQRQAITPAVAITPMVAATTRRLPGTTLHLHGITSPRRATTRSHGSINRLGTTTSRRVIPNSRRVIISSRRGVITGRIRTVGGTAITGVAGTMIPEVMAHAIITVVVAAARAAAVTVN